MAYRGEPNEMIAVAGPVSGDTVPAMVVEPKVPDADYRRVRFAAFLMLALAAIDACLYLPRLF